MRETERVRYLDGDGRVFLNRNSELYDLILLDAYPRRLSCRSTC